MAKAAVKQTKKEEGFSFKSLLPVLVIGTFAVVVVSFIGRIVTEK